MNPSDTIRLSAGWRQICWLNTDPNYVTIGCQRRTIANWERLSDRFGLRYGYTIEEVKKVRRVIKTIKGIRDALK